MEKVAVGREVEKVEEEVEEIEEMEKVKEEESNLGKSDDQRACLPQPPALLLRPKITKHEILFKIDENIFSIKRTFGNG